MKEKDKVMFAKLLLKITIIMILVSTIIKLFGFNLFEADYSNKLFLFLSNTIDKYGGEEHYIRGILNYFLLVVQAFIILRLSCKNKNRRIYYISALSITLVGLFSQIFIYERLWESNPQLVSNIRFVLEFLLLIIIAIVIDIRIKDKRKIKKSLPIKIILIWWKRIKRPVLVLLILSAYQLLVMFLRNITVIDRYESLYNFLLNFDYMILLIATYYIFIKRENNLKVKASFDFALTKLLNQKLSFDEIGSSIKGIKEKYAEFKKKDLEYKITAIVYTFLFVVQEIITLGILIFVATLNHYLIECLFIFIAFLISKRIFGAFHFKSFILCFFISNVTFFILSKLTVDINSTFVIPIIFGIGLSYTASRFIKKTNTTLYRGISKEDLSSICKNKNLSTFETNLLTDIYCHNYSTVKIGLKYDYTDRHIRNLKNKALEKLEA